MKTEKIILYTTELLWNPYKGIYKQTVYYSDGTVEEKFIPKGPIIMPNLLYLK
jgi:hypothetical protein